MPKKMKPKMKSKAKKASAIPEKMPGKGMAMLKKRLDGKPL